MALVDWSGLLQRSDMQVDYSYLCVPEDRDVLDSDVARLRFANDAVVDIAWDEAEGYIVTLSHGSYDKIQSQAVFRRVVDVIQEVQRLVAAEPVARLGD
ncbi:MAG: hypothetical protein KF708_21225 [Pirellulales bacterium]|nr:hypothetical protein [Pirellulales bacterium]